MTDREEPTTEAGRRAQLRAWALQMANAAAESGRRETNPARREWHAGAEHIANGLLTWIGDNWPESEARAAAPAGLRRSDLKIIEAEASTAHDFIWGTSDVSQEQASAAIWSIHNIVRAALAADSEPDR